MPIIKITQRQFVHLAQINNEIDELSKKRQTFLELILDSTEVAGQNIQISKISPEGIEYELAPDKPQLTKE